MAVLIFSFIFRSSRSSSFSILSIVLFVSGNRSVQRLEKNLNRYAALIAEFFGVDNRGIAGLDNLLVHFWQSERVGIINRGNRERIFVDTGAEIWRSKLTAPLFGQGNLAGAEEAKAALEEEIEQVISALTAFAKASPEVTSPRVP